MDVIFDDRDERAGVKFADLELIGIPHRIVISEKTLAENKLEYVNRQEGEKQLLSEAQVMAKLGL